MDYCFPQGHYLYQLINRNKVKVSYSCMQNIGQVISSHNKAAINKKAPQENKPTCNCRNPTTCPLDGKCLSSEIVYQATVIREDNSNPETYIKSTETPFQSRYNNHSNSFQNENNWHSTTLSQYIWTRKDNSLPFSLKWKIIAKGSAYSTSSKSAISVLKKILHHLSATISNT